MKNKIFYIYLVQISFMILFIFISSIKINNKLINKSDDYVDAFNNGWYMLDSDGNKVMVEAPSKQNIRKGEKLVIYNQLPDKDIEDMTLCFQTNHSFVNVYSSNNLIYSFGLEDGDNVKSPGCAWNFVEFPRSEYGKNIKIELVSKYDNSSGNIPSFLVGNIYSTKYTVIKENIIDLLVVFIIAITGILLVIISFILRRKYLIKDNLIYVGTFAIMISGWLLMDTHVIPIFVGHYYIMSMMAFIFLTMSGFPLIEFFRMSYCDDNKENIIFLSLDIISVTIGCLSILLHLLGIIELRESFLIEEIFIIVCFVSIFNLICRNVVTKSKKINKGHVIVGLIIVVCTIFDIYKYLFNYGKNRSASSYLTKLTILIIILALSYDSFKEILKLINDGRQIDSIKNIAYHDPLTKLRNRAAFDDRMKQITPSLYMNYGIVMLDLNNLKYFNDVFGHEMGDEYIISCTKIIGDMFAEKGQPYRIGGDEFCIIVPKLEKGEYNIIRKNIENRIDECNCVIYEKKMGISIGYAPYDSEQDIDLYSTMNRADMLMYEYKQKHKK